MLDGFLQRIHDFNGQNQAEIFGIPIFFAGNAHLRHELARGIIAAQFDTEIAELRAIAGEISRATVRCTKRVSAALQAEGPCVLELKAIFLRHIQFGEFIDVNVAHATRREDNRHCGDFRERFFQALSPPRGTIKSMYCGSCARIEDAARSVDSTI
jgi:hypothetical protein